MKSNIVYVKWKDFDEGVQILVRELYHLRHNYSSVFGLPRGGLPLAVALSHQLDLDLVTEIDSNTLIVDDISDTGTQLDKYKDNDIATLFTTSWTKTKPNFIAFHKMSRNDWLVFPWEEVIKPKCLKVMKGGLDLTN